MDAVLRLVQRRLKELLSQVQEAGTDSMYLVPVIKEANHIQSIQRSITKE